MNIDISENFVTGTCLEMCPKDEIEMREREKILHKFEIIPSGDNHGLPKADRKRVVKSFSRSAAGKLMNIPENIRPPSVLLKTVYYLLHDIAGKPNESWTTIYDFVMDRLRAVRQDLVIQSASAAHYVTILQPVIRFHTYSSYRLCEENYNVFDPHINDIHLQECLKRLLYSYDDCKLYNTGEECDNNSDKFLKENRPFFESLYILMNLGNNLSITRGLSLSETWKTELVRLSLDISLSYLRNNFFRVCYLFKKLPPLHAALVYLHIPELRRKALKIMSVAYNSKNLSFPLTVLKDLLLYESIEELKKNCEYYGLKVNETAVFFMKTDFDDDKNTVSPKKSRIIDQQLNDIYIPDLLLYNVT